MRLSRHLCIGPGGRKCNCCFPAPGSKDRKLEFRRAKRLDAREAFKREKEAYSVRTEPQGSGAFKCFT